MIHQRLETFLEVAETKSFTDAAHNLNISQPAVSQQIDKLEKELGYKLLSKRRRGVVLTPQGEAIRSAALSMRSDFASLLQALDPANTTRHIIFGTTLTVAECFVHQRLAAYASSHPEDTFSMHVDNTERLCHLLDEGTLQFALVEGAFDRSLYESRFFATHDFVCLSSPYIASKLLRANTQPKNNTVDLSLMDAMSDVRHITSENKEVQSSTGTIEYKTTYNTLSTIKTLKAAYSDSNKQLTLEDLLTQTLICREMGSGSRAIMDAALELDGLNASQFKRKLEVGNIAAIKQLVASHIGLTFMYRDAAMEELAKGMLVELPVHGFPIQHDINVIWRRNSVHAKRYEQICTELLFD